MLCFILYITGVLPLCHLADSQDKCVIPLDISTIFCYTYILKTRVPLRNSRVVGDNSLWVWYWYPLVMVCIKVLYECAMVCTFSSYTVKRNPETGFASFSDFKTPINFCLYVAAQEMRNTDCLFKFSFMSQTWNFYFKKPSLCNTCSFLKVRNADVITQSYQSLSTLSKREV